MKSKLLITLVVIIALICLGVGLYFLSNTPNADMIHFIQQSSSQKDASDIIPTVTLTPMPTPKFAKLGDRKYSRAPDVLKSDELLHKKAVIQTAKGTIEFELFGDETPKTVSNFIYLAKDGFYDTLTFHRVEPGFVIQGGDPNGNGTGGPGYAFADEPVKRKYTKGIVAMANAGPNTNGSQFFIMLADNPLPPNYTIFGQVIQGQDVVDQIVVGDVMQKVTIEDNPQ